MRRTAVTTAALLGVLGGMLLVPPTASAAEATGKRVCPTRDFVVGAGWGADRGRRAHAGIDLGGRRGTPIYAVEDGVIDRTKLQSNGALQIVMRGESGSKFYYGHMDTVLVKGGQKVDRGEVIGLMGDTGSPGAVHLHFEYWRSGGESDAVDPEPLVTRICRLGGGANDNGGNDNGGNENDAEPAPAPAPRPTADDAVEGDVFRN